MSEASCLVYADVRNYNDVITGVVIPGGHFAYVSDEESCTANPTVATATIPSGTSTTSLLTITTTTAAATSTASAASAGTSTTPIFTSWNGGEPNDYLNTTEDCAEFHYYPERPEIFMNWNDQPCTDERSFVCQRMLTTTSLPPPPPPPPPPPQPTAAAAAAAVRSRAVCCWVNDVARRRRRAGCVDLVAD